MGKRQFRIGDLARELHIKKFVIRFWEREFDIKSDRSEGGQRFYTDDDLKTFQTIKHLLYEQGFTIAGAKKHLQPALNGELIAPANASSAPDETETNFMPCTHDLEADEQEEMEADSSSIVPATTDYPQNSSSDAHYIEEHNNDAAHIEARVRQEVLEKIAPIKAKLLHLKSLLD